MKTLKSTVRVILLNLHYVKKEGRNSKKESSDQKVVKILLYSPTLKENINRTNFKYREEYRCLYMEIKQNFLRIYYINGTVIEKFLTKTEYDEDMCV